MLLSRVLDLKKQPGFLKKAKLFREHHRRDLGDFRTFYKYGGPISFSNSGPYASMKQTFVLVFHTNARTYHKKLAYTVFSRTERRVAHHFVYYSALMRKISLVVRAQVEFGPPPPKSKILGLS